MTPTERNNLLDEADTTAGDALADAAEKSPDTWTASVYRAAGFIVHHALLSLKEPQ